jgi:phage terminase large subunit
MPEIEIPEKVFDAFYDDDCRWRGADGIRYVTLEGGRGGGKSEGIARIGIARARSERCRILCTRMYQASIAESVHRTIVDAINEAGMEREFYIGKTSIKHVKTGSDFLFAGLQRDIMAIKSLKGVKYAWVEEAESVPKHIWQVLDPTIRVNGGQLWISYNPDEEMSATHQDFNVHAPPECVVRHISWRDNPWFPQSLNALRLMALRAADSGDAIAQAAYDWIWEGKCRRITDAIVFRNRVTIEDFDEPEGVRPFYGADWGFADDPAALVRCYMHEGSLFVTHAEFGYHIEMDDIPQLIFGRVPGSDKWPIKGDAAQPMIISYLKNRRGYNISAAEKWSGSVEDGIAHLQAFTRIVVHPRCRDTIGEEFRLYSWKTDPKQLDDKGNPLVLPILVDRYNHGIDALRYALDGYIRGRGPMVIKGSGRAAPSTPRPPRAPMRIRGRA